MDTDSFLLKFIGNDILDDVAKEPLAKFMDLMDLFNFILFIYFMDLFNFDINHALYNVENKGKFGLFKSETGYIPITESICLQPKCYSVCIIR